MRTTTAGIAGRQPLRWRLDDAGDPSASLRRRELAAGLATAAIAGQLLFAQATLLSAAILVVVGRASRWRPHWLAVPTVAAIAWLFMVGPAGTGAGLAAGSQRVAGYLLAAATHPRLLAHPRVLAAGGGWLPGGLSLALLAACGEAWLVLWIGWWRPGARTRARWQWRPGLVAAARGRMSEAALAAGHTVTSDGCAVGVATHTGKLAGFSWAEAMNGVLLIGQDADLLGLAISCAALRRRRTVVVLERAGAERGAAVRVVGARVADLAGSLSVPVTHAGEVAGSGSAVADRASVAEAIGRAIRRREAVRIDMWSAEAARRAVADVGALLTELRDLRLRADCLVWINGFEFMEPASVSELLALGRLTGTVVILSTTNSSQATNLVAAAAVVAVCHPVGADVGLALAARERGEGGASAFIGREIGSDAPLGAADPTSRPIACAREISADDERWVATARRHGFFSLHVFTPALSGSPRAVTSCRVPPIKLDHWR